MPNEANNLAGLDLAGLARRGLGGGQELDVPFEDGQRAQATGDGVEERGLAYRNRPSAFSP